MFIRSLTGVLITIVLLTTFSLGKTMVTGFISLLSLLALYEFFNTVQLTNKLFRVLGFISIFSYYYFFNFATTHFQVYSVVVLILMLSLMVFTYPKTSIKEVGLCFLGITYALMFIFIPLLYNSSMPTFWILSIFLIACSSDIFAYFTGLLFGKRKLAPILSPKKTVAGSIGGILGTGIVTTIFIYNFSPTHPILMDHKIFIIIGYMFLAGVSQIGDLAASAIKREFGVKDYGKLIPGHGGILDRFDSVVFISPLIYILSTLI